MESDPAANPALSAQGINDLVRWSIDLFRAQVRMYLKAAFREGFLPLTEPVKAPAERRIVLEGQEPSLWQIVFDRSRPAAARAEAQKRLYELQELRNGNGQTGT